MAGIFISYRRTDSAEIVGRIYDRLTARMPRSAVFRDIDSIPLGKCFPDVLAETVAATRVGLVIIGPDWFDALAANGQRRLDDPEDFVRLEVAALLARDIDVIPCLVGHAKMRSPEALPEALRPLALRNAIAIRPDPDFHTDMNCLFDQLSATLPELSTPSPGSTPPRRTPATHWIVLALLTLASIWIGLEIGWSRDRLLASVFLFVLPAVFLGAPLLQRPLRQQRWWRRNHESD